MMQTLGTDWGRDLISPNLWTLLAHQRLLRNGPGMVIPDIRFENEAAWVRDHGGMVIHLTRPDAEPVQKHPSENGVKRLPQDVQLFNIGTLEELQSSVKALLNVYD
jgi:hypothetical protein